jgi:hypothetical protein
MATKLDDLIEEFRTEGREEDAEELEKLRGSTLRKQAEAATKLEKRNAELEARLEAVEKAPKIEKAFKDYGIDFDQLSKLERKAIESYDGELSEEAIASFVEENELSLTESEGKPEDEEDEEPAAAKVAKAARRSAQGTGGHKAPVITPEETEEWSTEKLMRFSKAHPEQWELLKQGETVTGITFD